MSISSSAISLRKSWEIQAYEPESWQAHSTDLDFLTSQQARQIIEQEGIVLLDYKPLQQVWQANGSSTT